MDSRASTRTRLSVLPVFIALVFNLVAPVASIALPAGAPSPLGAPEPVAAAAPEQVTFTLEGCNLTTGAFIESTLTCTEPGYTTGNLGKLWAELDRVPHRLTAENKTVAQTYDIKLSADHLDDGFLGYDQISVPTLKSGACTFTVSNQFVDAGVAGGADSTISRTMTVTQPAMSTCVFDFNMRLALGSAQYPGSSLRAYLIAEGVGAKSVPLPVDKDFPAQELRKEMTATQGQAYSWSVSKSSDPTSLHFANTCLPSDAARTATVDVTISWTRTGPTASGATLITTKVYAENPSERTIQVNVTDDIFTGTAATNSDATKISTASAGPINVSANSEVLVLEHVFEYSGSATQFNDVATATYVDPVNPDVAIPGNTTAAADATTQPAGGAAANATAIITDSEWITGDGLSFSVAAPAFGSFTNGYVSGNEVLPGASVEWSSGVVSGSGSITFTKTVSVDEPRIITGGAALSDAATVLTADGQQTLATSGQLDIDITADATVSLEIDKTIPAGALRSGESVTFEFEVYAGSDAVGVPVATTSITFDAGGATAKTATVTGLAPGTYTVHELPQSNWATLDDETVSITLPACSATVEFDNTELLPDLSATKTADAASVTAGEQIGFTITASNGDGAGTGVAKDVELEDLLPGGVGIDWSIAGDSQDGGDCSISGPLGTQVLECSFGDLAPGASASVHVVSDTTGESCALVENSATISAFNVDEPLTPSDETEVLCPDLVVEKRQVDENGDPTDEPISAGDTAFFEIEVTNLGPGTAFGFELDDEPQSGTWTVLDDGGLTCPAEIGAGGATCTADELAPGTYTLLLGYETAVADCGMLVNDVTVAADNEPASAVTAENSDSATSIVECPGLNIIKRQVDENGDPAMEPILAGDPASFEIVVWNVGPGEAKDVVVNDDLPAGLSWDFAITDGDGECFPASSQEEGGEVHMSLMCELGDLAVDESVTILVWAGTDRTHCGTLTNLATVDGSNNDDEVPAAEATILVSCPELSLVKENDAVGSVLPGTVVTYTLTLTVSDEGLDNGEASDVTVVDLMPAGLIDPTDISDGGTASGSTITWNLGTLGEGTYELTYRATVADDVENGDELVNVASATSPDSQCPDLETLGPECEDESTVVVRVPTLVIDKEADVEEILITIDGDDQTIEPERVTWTLTWTLADGPVTNAVITDEIPEGLVYVDGSASDGGVYDAATNTLTWTFPTLSESGSVTFQTEIDAETISRVAPTVNVAVIGSDQTPEDEGQDQVTVTVEQELGGNPTPTPRLPDTAMGLGVNGQPVTIPVELLAAAFLASLGAMALAAAKARRGR